IYRLPAWQVAMVETARRCGASAKFAGSGGAIVGLYRDEKMYGELKKALAAIDCRTMKPQVVG
ncbi:GHMP kinase, partial [bacterium]|nr:GHMP kinase [bacterium]